ncbi:phage tail tip lysozyme [Aurantimonas coralicida]|uniref:phage tail tip lysozyme n=1 Tax=Aurantimonas coralicida TaxID=182270 RepID=UPI000411015A|nr:phage tail tip lysozyme [Aurantimonas coralicida]
MTPEQIFRSKAPWIMATLMQDFPIGVDDAAAVLGNLGHECLGFTKLQEISPTVAGSRGGYGWPQWTGPRRRAYEAYCARNRLDPASDRANYAYLFLELKGPEKKAIDKLVAADGLDRKVEAFELAFERAGSKHYSSRKHWARIAREAWYASTAEQRQAPHLPAPATLPESGMVLEPEILPPAGDQTVTTENLTPIEQMNKPVKGAIAGMATTSVTGAILFLAASAGWLPDAWESPEALVALALVATNLPTQIANFIASYWARDKRYAA